MAYPAIFLGLIILFAFKLSVASSVSPVSFSAFPLRTQKISSIPKQHQQRGLMPNKVPFHHNVTLTVTLSVGTPPQPVSMVLDTGSELSWLHCKKTPNLNSVFNPTLSKSYTGVPCSSPLCKTRPRDLSTPATCDPKSKLCHVSVSYADFSSLEGNLANETFRMENSPVPGVAFGCMDSGFSSTAEEDAETTGLLGMNRGSLSFVTQMGYPKFSYCISSGQGSPGVLLLGEGGTFPWLKPLSYTPLVQSPSQPLPYFDRVAYSVHLEGVRVGSKVLSLSKSILEPDHTGAGQTVVDSGTQFTFLLGEVYAALRAEFLAQTKGILRVLEDPNYAFQGVMDLCYRVPLSQRGVVERLPAVTLLFRGAEMTVSAERLLYRVPGEVRGTDAVHCLTFGNSDLLGVESYIIGHHHQQNMWMEFDLANSRVGLAQFRCDLASQKLGLGP